MTQAVAKGASKSDVSAPLSPGQTMAKDLLIIANVNREFTDEDRQEFMISALDRIAKADTLEDIVNANDAGMDNIEDLKLVGVPLTINEVTFAQASKGELKVLAMVDATTDVGDSVKFGIGAPNVVAVLFRLKDTHQINRDKHPRIVIRSKSTQSGNTRYVVGLP